MGAVSAPFAPAQVSGTAHREVRNPGPVHDNAVLARVYFPGITRWPFSKADVDCKLLVNIAFDELQLSDGRPSRSG
jgi:hypothetical protein